MLKCKLLNELEKNWIKLNKIKIKFFSFPDPGVSGLIIAPIQESVAKVAFKGSDSNHLSRI